MSFVQERWQEQFGLIEVGLTDARDRRPLEGRRLKTPTWEGLRPTSDKLRETLFNILAPRIAGARVLDGYAGTGALGIEALSRGARHVTFVEKDRRAAALIEAERAGVRLEGGYTVACGDCRDVARWAGGRVRSDSGSIRRTTSETSIRCSSEAAGAARRRRAAGARACHTPGARTCRRRYARA